MMRDAELAVAPSPAPPQPQAEEKKGSDFSAATATKSLLSYFSTFTGSPSDPPKTDQK